MTTREMPRILGLKRTKDDSSRDDPDPLDEVFAMEARRRLEDARRQEMDLAAKRRVNEQLRMDNDSKRLEGERARLDVLQSVPIVLPPAAQGATTSADSISVVSTAMASFSNILSEVLKSAIQGNSELMANQMHQLEDRYQQVQNIIQQQLSGAPQAQTDAVDMVDRLLQVSERFKDFFAPPVSARSGASDPAAAMLAVELKRLEMENARALEMFQLEMLKWREESSLRREQLAVDQSAKSQQYGFLQTVSMAIGNSIRDMRGDGGTEVSATAQKSQPRAVLGEMAPVEQRVPDVVGPCPTCGTDIEVYQGQRVASCPNGECGKEWEIQWQ